MTNKNLAGVIFQVQRQ